MEFLVIDDDKVFREATCLVIEDEGHYADTASTSEIGITRLRENNYDAILLDLNLGRENGLTILPQLLKIRPNIPIVMFSAQSTVKRAVQAIHLGAIDFLEKPFTREQFHAVLARIQVFRKMGTRIEHLEEEAKETKAQSPEPLFDFETPAMRQLMEVLTRSAKSAASVLILGESGTGKELVARSIHYAGPYKDKPFIPVDCGALVPTLIESELFGYVRGAFTGALRHKEGLLATAEGGTVFLDEVGELPIDLQSKLLRAIQEKEIRPVGGTRAVPINVRILAATNRDLDTAVSQGTFRRDLYFRLNVLTLRIPPLRERKTDIPLLVSNVLERINNSTQVQHGIGEDALRLMLDYDWPGNVRELENCIERACTTCSLPTIHVTDLPTQLQNFVVPAQPSAGAEAPSPKITPLDELEKQAILHAIQILDGDKLEAARRLGIGKTTLYRKLKEYGTAL